MTESHSYLTALIRSLLKAMDDQYEQCLPMMKSSRGGGLLSEERIRCRDSSDK